MIIDRTNYYNKRIVAGTGNDTICIFYSGMIIITSQSEKATQ